MRTSFVDRRSHVHLSVPSFRTIHPRIRTLTPLANRVMTCSDLVMFPFMLALHINFKCTVMNYNIYESWQFAKIETLKEGSKETGRAS